ncbi:glutamine-hydrolyzing carbamoyl-phosphate synthase small subunit [Helicobacter cetorum]|uniref:Carbamoyl phosphate synthase small chain n=1 Tax=Helicobacter cetorum (strain ATCC BAA-540 / CCUG 52418 / MIT 99-5656) TaxID=1163745 RepID=I0ERW3_HELCM|nr:glutamine-hydrolyzing carbamoyl-phosphate synthase small subunit [Helicobacter cetorum]AFI05682.1 carbamoyl phosphate synthase small subunit [Helicobacter cetorum MIT 99-5656]
MVSLYLENGLFLQAQSFGASGTQIGELVFNTSMSGYQEVISDPSYKGQFVVFSMPEIGIVGTNVKDDESPFCCAGILVRHYNEFFSNARANLSLSAYLKERNVLGISGIDTRSLIKTLRNNGCLMMVASTIEHDKNKLKEILKNAPKISHSPLVESVSTQKIKTHKHGVFDFKTLDYKPFDETMPHKTIAVLDFGAKGNILNELQSVGLKALIYPHNTQATELIKAYEDKVINGIFLSNGPGDPLSLQQEIEEIKQLIEAKIPMFGICLGHQLLSIAQGYPTYKLKFGHHGSNHPVKNLKTNAIEITAQNHNYCVPEEIEKIAVITHRNLFDNTIEGVRYINAPIISVQHHPESSPGPKESHYIFKEFVKLLEKF